jgi:hypothetical protein
LRDLKGDFATSDVPVGRQDLPTDAVFAWQQSSGLRCESVSAAVFGDRQRLRSIRLDQSKAGTGGVDANIEAEPDGDVGAGDGGC